MSLCNIAKYLTHAVPTSKKVEIMVKVLFSVLIYQTFKAQKEAMKYAVSEVTIFKIKIFALIFIFKNVIKV